MKEVAMFFNLSKKSNMSLIFFILVFFCALSRWSVHADIARQNYTTDAVEKLIDVGQCRLNLRVIKGGNITILFESGGGMDSTEWSKLAPEIASKTGATIVTYDRPGFGKSDLPETPYDMRTETKLVLDGLKKLGLEKNLILVGHSYGGWLIRLIASMYPDNISGMVFIDPFSSEFVDILGVKYLDNHPMMGKLPFDTSKPEKLSKFQRALIRMVSDGLQRKTEIMRKTNIPGGIPVRLITCGKSFLPKPEEQMAWRRAHEQIVSKIKGAKLIVAEQSGHMIPFEQPGIIIEAIIEVIQLTK
jgi:pimeloyl-ACP methyl ester carboxylesterase